MKAEKLVETVEKQVERVVVETVVEEEVTYRLELTVEEVRKLEELCGLNLTIPQMCVRFVSTRFGFNDRDKIDAIRGLLDDLRFAIRRAQ
jgi:hypothetical protein